MSSASNKRALSTFGNRIATESGIGELMQDLGDAIASADENLYMLGGGQPSHIPQMEAIWSQRLTEIASDAATIRKMVGNYQPPGGDEQFRSDVAKLFRQEYGWPITGENVCVTAGGQTAFFLLLNALAGRFDDGQQRKVLLPLVPEYIGYADQSTSGDLFRAERPKIEKMGQHEFKYSIDFDALTLSDEIAAICLSRPTNPSANVVRDEELLRLSELAEQHDVPLIVDNAYGDPFPGVIFTDTKPMWRPEMILTHSLSKFGLPGTRTGIVIADPDVVEMLAGMNAIASLANNNVGQTIVHPLIQSGEMIRLSKEVIRPFYERRAKQAIDWLREAFDDASSEASSESIPYRYHRSEGAFFLWLWFEGLPISSAELYRRLKNRGVLVISGHYFFFGLEDDDWPHRNECLRISFTAADNALRRGLGILADEVKQLYKQG